ncbi:hypothetical protein BCY84_11086 [Trypanosoma cruzi cruzi]|uniref:Uncharacterized protein n=1 Tax=Trypanosoma cruzi TaxID=5693 RepID=A0A2V2UKI2_TRYCR|nr:hypothetical protein BCY84_11086 [Trypanosoma cruzi cruzi]PWU84571.1 hypothetical protein C4B63_216g38 [Trypanosoma cruzi]
MDTAEDGDYLQFANKLYAASKPFLAIKAYERAVSEVEAAAAATSDPKPLPGNKLGSGNALFKDFILHCNAFGVKAATSDTKMAGDFLRLCFKELQGRNYLQGDLDANDPSQFFIPIQEDRGIAFLVSLTLSNWACLLLRSGNTREAAAFLQLALTNSMAEELTRIILLNICAVDVHNCLFFQVREKAMEALFEDGETEEEGQEKMDRDNAAREDVNGLLCAFACHNVAIAEEYLQPQEAESHYNQGKEMLASSPYQRWSSVIECARRRFLDIIQRRRYEATRRREAAEAEMEAAKQVEATVRRKARATGSATARQPSAKPGNRGKKYKKRISGLTNDTKDESIELPPISEYLRQKMQTQGLSNVVVPILRVVDVRKFVFGGIPAHEDSFFPFRESVNLNNVAMVLLCEETPLQVADEAELKDTGPPRKTIWTPFLPRRDDTLIIVPPKPKPGAVLSRDAANIAKSFMPPPLSEKSIENAQRSVTAFKKILNHRLLMLLRAENAFEEKWKATGIVKRALVAFNLAQDMLKLKETIKWKRETRAILENASARRIVRFFRLIIERKSNSAPIMREARVKYFEEKAAIALQKYARRWLAVKELRSLQRQRRAEILRVMKIQSTYRMHATRSRYIAYKEEKNEALRFEKETVAREFAAIQIQRAYRRHAYRLRRWYEGGEKRQFILHHFRSSREYYATLIQKTFRGFLVRRVYGPAVYAKRCYGRNCYRAALVNTCATIIQSVFRGYRVRRVTRIPLQQHLRQCVVQRAREKMESLRRIQNEAARVIQCAYRSYSARRVANELRTLRERERLLRRNRVYPSFRLEEQVY